LMMADDADLASDMLERVMDRLMAERKPEAPPYSGVCLWCGVKTAEGIRWCSPEHRDSWAVAYHGVRGKT